MLINLASLMPGENQNDVVRWTLLGYELSVLKARTLIDSVEGKTYLEESKLIVGDEWESMVNGDRHTTVWVSDLATLLLVFSHFMFPN